MFEILIEYIFNAHFLYQLFASLLVLWTIKLLHFVRQRNKRYKLFKYYGIPGPEPSIFHGSYCTYKRNDALFKVDEEMAKKYGKTYGFFFADEPVITTTDLNLLKKIFLEEIDSFKLRARLFLSTPLNHGILFTNFDRWKFMRKVMAPQFSSYKVRGESATQFIEDSIKRMIDYIDQRIVESQVASKELNIDINDLMKSTSLHLISALAVKLPDVEVKENEKYVKNLDGFLANADRGIINVAVLLPFIKPVLDFLANNFEYSKTMYKIHQEIEKLMKPSSQNKSLYLDANNNQLMNTLIRLYHEGKMTKKELLANADSLLIAGYDTTSTTLTYLLWVLGKHPDIQEDLRSELKAHGIHSKYLEQVIKETMRLYPMVISFVSRLATRTVVVDDLIIPQGTRIAFNAWLTHLNPDIWQDPLKFDPSRFRDGVNIHPCAYAPFGLGPRKCLGYELAMLEMKMIISDLILRYKMILKSPQSLELTTCAVSLSKPKEKVILEFQKLN